MNSSRSYLGPGSADMNRGVLNSSANSGPSAGASSMVTDGNSAMSGGPHLQRSASINTDSYLRLPASPMSFSSNNISGSSVIDGGCVVQQSSQQEQMKRRGMMPGSTSQYPTPYDLGNLLQPQKRPRLDMRQEEMMQPQLLQQFFERQDVPQLQRQESSNLQKHYNSQMQLLIQQKLLQQQQMLHSLPPMQRAHFQQQQQQQQQQLRQQLQQQALQQGLHAKRPFDSGICARRLTQYMYHQRHRPPENSINYWKKIVAEYFSPHAKKKWCLSSYNFVGNQALGVFPQASKAAWNCDLCGSKSGKGFEATIEVLPRLCQIQFDSGIIDELLFLDIPHESRLSSGIMVLEYQKAIEESIYEHVRVVREGQLRIIFTPDLKILSWEFCTRRHEEFLSRRLVVPQVNQLVQLAQKYQKIASENGSSGISQQDLQTNCNMFVTAGRQLVKNLELQVLNDLGFSKRFVRCLQISEVVNSMKDLIDFSIEHKHGPIENLKLFPRHSAAKLGNQKVQETEENTSSQSSANDKNVTNKVLAMASAPNPHVDKILSGGRVSNPCPQNNTFALNNFQALLRENQTSTNPGPFHLPENNNAVGRSRLQRPATPCSVSLANASGSSLSASQQQFVGNFSHPRQNPSSQANQHLQQHVIQQLLQEVMNNNNKGMSHQSLTGSSSMRSGTPKQIFSDGIGTPGMTTSLSGNGMEFVNDPSMPKTSSSNTNRSNTLGYVPHGDFPGSMTFRLKQEMPDMGPEISDFADSDFFNDDTWTIR